MAITDRRLTRVVMGSSTRDRLKSQKAGRRSLSQNHVHSPQRIDDGSSAGHLLHHQSRGLQYRIPTPTAERSDLKFALNAPFKPDAGRLRLAVNNCQNRKRHPFIRIIAKEVISASDLVCDRVIADLIERNEALRAAFASTSAVRAQGSSV
jgi:hypothetical protein